MTIPQAVDADHDPTRYGIQIPLDIYRAHTDTGWAYTPATSPDDARARITHAYQTRRGYTPTITNTHIAPPATIQTFIEEQLDIIDGGGTLAPLHADLLRLLTERTPGDIPTHLVQPRPAPPHPGNRDHLRHIAGSLGVLYAWCLGAIAPALISVTYWTGHYFEWWTVIGWDRNAGWFTNRATLTGYILWGLIPIQSLWFLGWLLAWGPWLERRITLTPYMGPAVGGVTYTGRR